MQAAGGCLRVSQVKSVDVEISVVLGRCVLPMAQLLRMGRGAVIPLDANEFDEVWILANNHPVARGAIQISEDRISISVTGPADVYDYMAGAA
jgi:flagellar motor switch protein FliN/FliY